MKCKPHLIKKSEVAKILGVSERTIDRYRAAGIKLGEVQLGATLRFRIHVVRKLADKGFKVPK